MNPNLIPDAETEARLRSSGLPYDVGRKLCEFARRRAGQTPQNAENAKAPAVAETAAPTTKSKSFQTPIMSAPQIQSEPTNGIEAASNPISTPVPQPALPAAPVPIPQETELPPDVLRSADTSGGAPSTPPRRLSSNAPSAWSRCVDALTNDALERLAAWRGYTLDFCLYLKAQSLVGLFQGRIAFPIANSQGEIIGCHHRQLAGEGDWQVTPFKGTSVSMFPFAVNGPETKPRVLAFESQWDMFAFLDKAKWQNGDIPEYGFVATRGATNTKRINEVCRTGVIVAAFGQNDQPGQKWVSRLATTHKGTVLQVRIPAPHKDLNDWTKSGATWEQIENANQNGEPLREPLANETGPGVDADDDEEAAYDDAGPTPTTRDGRALVLLPCKNRLVSQFAADLGRALANTGLYNRNGNPFVVDPVTRNFKEMTAQSFRTWAEQYAVCFVVETPEDGPRARIKKSMSVTEAGAALSSPQFLRCLRSIRNLNQVQLPVIRQSGNIELLPVGYDLESKTFTFDTPGLDYPRPMTLDQAKAGINGLFQEFCFPDDEGRSLSVAVAGMTTLFGYGLLPQGALVPCFIIMANAEGAGKTLIVKVQVVPVFGKFVAGSKPTNEEELSKLLLTAVIEGRPYIVFDNIKDHLDSASLEAFLTSSTWNGRILGSSKSYAGEKNTVVFATGNACTVSPDMRRRSLFVELFMKQERPEERRFDHPLDVAYLLENRGLILSALWALVQDWDAKGRPRSSLSHSSFPEWANIIPGLLENAGYTSPIKTPRNDVAADRDGNDMRKLLAGLASNTLYKKFTFQQLVEFAREVGAFEFFVGGEGDGELDRKTKTAFSRMLKRYDRRMIGDFHFSLEGQGHTRRYAFKKQGVELPSLPPELPR